MMHFYFKQLFVDILCKSIMIFQNSLILGNPVSFELADIHKLYVCKTSPNYVDVSVS